MVDSSFVVELPLSKPDAQSPVNRATKADPGIALRSSCRLADFIQQA
jgi:hypothetical protein